MLTRASEMGRLSANASVVALAGLGPFVVDARGGGGLGGGDGDRLFGNRPCGPPGGSERRGRGRSQGRSRRADARGHRLRRPAAMDLLPDRQTGGARWSGRVRPGWRATVGRAGAFGCIPRHGLRLRHDPALRRPRAYRGRRLRWRTLLGDTSLAPSSGHDLSSCKDEGVNVSIMRSRWPRRRRRPDCGDGWMGRDVRLEGAGPWRRRPRQGPPLP